jgi:hypothetical protein
MAGPNPLVNLGTLNRLRGSLIFPQFDALNISASFLTKAGIRLSVEGDTTEMLPQMVSMVQSQQPYLKATILVGLVKTTALVAAFKNKMESDSNLGQVTFISDSAAIPSYDFQNCAIEGFEGIDASGTSADYPIRISGTYYINSSLFNLA